MKSKKQLLSMMLAALMAFSFAFALTSCGSADPDYIDYEMNEDDSGTSNQNKPQSKKAQEMNAQEDNFYGTWKATSSDAENLYGHLIITINEDGTFDADVTDEKFSGTWKKTSGGISYTSELMNGKIYFGESLDMVIEDAGVSVTLEKQ